MVALIEMEAVCSEARLVLGYPGKSQFGRPIAGFEPIDEQELRLVRNRDRVEPENDLAGRIDVDADIQA